MKHFIILTSFLLVTVTFVSCKKDNFTTTDCSILQQGIVTNEAALVKAEINKICNGLSAGTAKENLQVLTEKISSRCKMNAVILCTECIYTNPAQSEIKISFSVSGTQYSQVLDIISDKKGLRFAGMHE